MQKSTEEKMEEAIYIISESFFERSKKKLNKMILKLIKLIKEINKENV